MAHTVVDMGNHKPVGLNLLSLETLCFTLVANNLSWIFVANTLLGVALSSILSPTLYKYSNDEFVQTSNVPNGLWFVMIALLCDILSIFHNNQFIQSYKRSFLAKVQCGLEDNVNQHISLIHWNKLRDLNNNELDRKKDIATMYVLDLITKTINTFIYSFSFFGYTYWVCVISPASLLLYGTLMVLLLALYPYKAKSINNATQIYWDKYYDATIRRFTDIIHHDSQKNLDVMKQCINSIEECRIENRRRDALFTDIIDTVFTIGFIINCALFAHQLSPVNAIIYVQYTCFMKNSISSSMSLYCQYMDTKHEYGKLEDILSTSTRRPIVTQAPIPPTSVLTIESLDYVYPSNSTEAPFSLTLASTLTFSRGDIVKLEGNSGNGKSTFTDILNGIISYTDYTASIWLDKERIIGFDCFTESRYYHEQQEAIFWQPSLYEIISNKEDINCVDEDLVWNALTIASCLDFVKRENVANGHKWIHTKKLGLSGGQKGRIAIARTMYRIMIKKPAFITFDEVDRAIQSELVVSIMKNIYAYTREHNILVFVICHNQDVKAMNEYDKTIRFTNGIVSAA